MYRVLLVGRPNAGKSTLFNALIGRERAIVSPRPHATRDLQHHVVRGSGQAFLLTDMGGLGESHDPLDQAAMKRARNEISLADLVLWVIDAREAGSQDKPLRDELMKSGVPFILVANKIDDDAGLSDLGEVARMGAKSLVPLSATTGRGLGELRGLVERHLSDLKRAKTPPRDVKSGDLAAKGEYTVALLGRPNAGKSSLLNALLGEERALVSPVAGTTRDVVAGVARVKGHALRFLDTAGLRRKAREKDELEASSVGMAIGGSKAADVSVLLLDGTGDLGTLTIQDKKIASVIERHRGSLVVAVNKWDLVTERTWEETEDRIRYLFPHIQHASVLPISAKTGYGLGKLLNLILANAKSRQAELPTAALNKLLQQAVRIKPPSTGTKGTLKIHYGVQTQTDPPVFRIFVNNVSRLDAAYGRYIEGYLRKSAELKSSPCVIEFRGRSSDEKKNRPETRKPSRKTRPDLTVRKRHPGKDAKEKNP